MATIAENTHPATMTPTWFETDQVASVETELDTTMFCMGCEECEDDPYCPNDVIEDPTIDVDTLDVARVLAGVFGVQPHEVSAEAIAVGYALKLDTEAAYEAELLEDRSPVVMFSREPEVRQALERFVPESVLQAP